MNSEGCRLAKPSDSQRREPLTDLPIAGISTSTAWGMTTSQAAGDSQSLATALQRSREFLVEQHELQQLPVSAMIVSYAGPSGRQVEMADANPGIGGLSAATLLTPEEFGNLPAAAAGAAAAVPAAGPGSRPVPKPRPPGDGPVTRADQRASGDRPPPNLGPPAPRLDWRRRQ